MSGYHHPLVYSAAPSGLRLEMRDGSARFISSQLLQVVVTDKGTQADIHFATAVVRITGSGLQSVLDGLAADGESPLGRLAAISERPAEGEVLPPGPGYLGPKISVKMILVDDKLEPFIGGADES